MGELDFIINAGKLKEIKRQGWVLKGLKNPESVAEHSFRAAIIAWVLAKKLSLNEEKTIKMCLIHDIGETIIGDITPMDGIPRKKKIELEKKAVKKICLMLGIKGKEFLKLWQEFQKQESKEAIIAKEAECFETLLQCLEYWKKFPEKDFSDIFNSFNKKIKNKELKGLVKQSIKRFKE
jgi:putative hydrolase of HD superfamily